MWIPIKYARPKSMVGAANQLHCECLWSQQDWNPRIKLFWGACNVMKVNKFFFNMNLFLDIIENYYYAYRLKITSFCSTNKSKSWWRMEVEDSTNKECPTFIKEIVKWNSDSISTLRTWHWILKGVGELQPWVHKESMQGNPQHLCLI